ncbi:SDR family oxidoreductase [Oceanicoccus sp. KOV_DT_Chl]|uniref:SDR family oxidoreductase n=1 Tax=Oceanicoccus sp. KOV_DT_Chl TaxID=1904639 RepID=UPI001359A03C|nr:SDR family oxidoreductase [Oceanicoccus sp. KOV_DT_Chl]
MNMMKSIWQQLAVMAMIIMVSGCSLFTGSQSDSARVDKNNVILVVGATGKTGRLIVADLQQQGFQVRAMVRDSERGREILGEDVNLVQADLTVAATLPAAVAGVSAIINAAGAGLKGTGKATPEWIDYQGTLNLLAASKPENIKKFVLISSMGVTQPDHFLNRIANNVLRWKLKGEDALRASDVNYTIVRPGGLTDKAGPEQVVQFYQGDTKKGGPIRREDVSRVVIAALLMPEADYKTFEVMAVVGPRENDFSARFSQLKADK